MFVQQTEYYADEPSVQANWKKKTGNVATPLPPQKNQKNKKQIRQTKSTQGTAATRGKKEKTMWFCLLSRYRRGAKQLKTGWRHRTVLDKKIVLLIVPLPKRCKATRNRLNVPLHSVTRGVWWLCLHCYSFLSLFCGWSGELVASSGLCQITTSVSWLMLLT